VSKIRVFVDSNIWFSAFYKKGSVSELIEKLLQKKFEIVISEIVLEEALKNIKKKIPNAFSLICQFFQEHPVTVIKNPQLKQIKKFTGLAQKKDLPILVSALDYQCRFFITGNKKDFKVSLIGKRYNLSILSTREMLNVI